MVKDNSLLKGKKDSLDRQSANEKKGCDTDKIWAIIGKIALTILPALVALIGGYYIFDQVAHPDFYCSPKEGEAPLTVKFVNEKLVFFKGYLGVR